MGRTTRQWFQLWLSVLPALPAGGGHRRPRHSLRQPGDHGHMHSDRGALCDLAVAGAIDATGDFPNGAVSLCLRGPGARRL